MEGGGGSRWRMGVWPRAACGHGTIVNVYTKATIFLRPNPGTFSRTVPQGGLLSTPRSLSPLSCGFCARHLLRRGAPLCRFPDMIVNSAPVFIPIADLSVTVKNGDISGDSSSRTF